MVSIYFGGACLRGNKNLKIFYKTFSRFGGTIGAKGAETYEERNKNGSL